MYRPISCFLVAASCVILVAADQPGDVAAQASDRIKNIDANINAALANAPPGSSVSSSSSCTTVNGQMTCIDSKNVSSAGVAPIANGAAASGTGTNNGAATSGTGTNNGVVVATGGDFGTPAPAVVVPAVEVKTPAPSPATAAPSTAKVQIVVTTAPAGSSASGLLASCAATLILALLACAV